MFTMTHVCASVAGATQARVYVPLPWSVAGPKVPPFAVEPVRIARGTPVPPLVRRTLRAAVSKAIISFRSEVTAIWSRRGWDRTRIAAVADPGRKPSLATVTTTVTVVPPDPARASRVVDHPPEASVHPDDPLSPPPP